MTEAAKVIKRNRAGDIVAIYPSAAIAAREEGVAIPTIRLWCKNPTTVQSNGHTFEHGERLKVMKTLNRPTLCWLCGNACGGCSWSRALKPVEGWTAERNDVWCPHADGKGNDFSKFEESYIVIECPEFIPDGRKRED